MDRKSFKRQGTHTEEGVILRKTPLRESDLILTILGAENGKLSALARGARRSKKRFMGAVDVLDCGSFELAAGVKTDLFTLRSAGAVRSFASIRESIWQLCIAATAVEITDLFTLEGDASGSFLFSPLVEMLQSVNSAGSAAAGLTSLAGFILEVLAVSGYDPANIGLIGADAQAKGELRRQIGALLALCEQITGVRLKSDLHEVLAKL